MLLLYLLLDLKSYGSMIDDLSSLGNHETYVDFVGLLYVQPEVEAYCSPTFCYYCIWYVHTYPPGAFFTKVFFMSVSFTFVLMPVCISQ